VTRLSWIAALCLSMAACAMADRQAPTLASDHVGTGREILVMLRMAPPHYRPELSYGSTYGSRFGDPARRRVAEELARDYRLKLVTSWPMSALAVDCFVMELPPGASAVELVRRLSLDPRVESAQSMNLFHTLGESDPLYPLQPSGKLWHLAALHRVASGAGVLVAEVDTGVEVEHPDLRGQIAAARDLVDGGSHMVAERHGTAVAGIIAARADNGIGIAGVAPQARLLVLRACWQERGGTGEASCSSFTLAKALQAAIDERAEVINLSLAGPFDRLLQRLIEVALAQGAAVVGAVDPQAPKGGFPASSPGVLAVAGDNEKGSSDAFLCAPGHDIPATLPGGQWGLVSGSSFAAAEVTGVVALLQGLSPQLSSAHIREALAAGSRSGNPAERPLLVDACAAVARIAPTCPCHCSPRPEASYLASP
jgi:hypothetical protein